MPTTNELFRDVANVLVKVTDLLENLVNDVEALDRRVGLLELNALEAPQTRRAD